MRLCGGGPTYENGPRGTGGRCPNRSKTTNLLQLHRPVRVVEERLPRLVLPVRELEIQERAAAGLFRLADQAHVGLLRRAAALLDVAIHAGANDVVPGARAALAARDHVVQAQLVGREFPAAVLALVVVPGEDVPPVELHRLLRQLVVVDQADDARHLDLARRRAHPVVVLFAEVPGAVFAQLAPRLEIVRGELTVLEADHLGQVLAKQTESPAHGDDVHRHEELVQDQNARFESRTATLHSNPLVGLTRPAGVSRAEPVTPKGRVPASGGSSY